VADKGPGAVGVLSLLPFYNVLKQGLAWQLLSIGKPHFPLWSVCSCQSATT